MKEKTENIVTVAATAVIERNKCFDADLIDHCRLPFVRPACD